MRIGQLKLTQLSLLPYRPSICGCRALSRGLASVNGVPWEYICIYRAEAPWMLEGIQSSYALTLVGKYSTRTLRRKKS